MNNVAIHILKINDVDDMDQWIRFNMSGSMMHISNIASQCFGVQSC